jgi:hypothetical protein
MWNNSMPRLHEVTGGPKQRLIVEELLIHAEDASLQHYGPLKWVWLRFKIRQNHWSIQKRSCIVCKITSMCLNIQPPISMCSWWCSTDWHEHSKMLGCCCLSSKRNKILFRSTSYHHLRLLDWMGRANGLASQVTEPNTKGFLPMGPH